MARFEKRNDERIVDQGNGAIYAAVLLDAADAVEVYGDGEVAGLFSDFEADIEDARKLKRDLGEKYITTEDRVIVAQVSMKDESTIELTLLCDDNVSKRMMDVLRRKAHTFRLVAPGSVADGVQADGLPFHEVTALRNARASASWEKEYKPGVRKLATVLTGSRTRDGKPSVSQVAVDLTDEATWPAEIADVKSDAMDPVV